ncbi:hypothetical protein ACS0TY_024109 [Phlomoides rotata]
MVLQMIRCNLWSTGWIVSDSFAKKTIHELPAIWVSFESKDLNTHQCSSEVHCRPL